MMATPLVSKVQAKKTVIPYDYTIIGPPAAETIVDEKFVADGQLRIAKGTYRTYSYDGPLGVGSVYTEAIISITHAEDPETYPYTKFYGNGNYRAILTITSGPYGTGTLEGQMILYWDGDLSMPFGPETHYYYWGDTIYSRGTGDLEGIMIKQTMFSTMLSPTLMSTQFTGEVILS
jgi:hypothetical protein